MFQKLKECKTLKEIYTVLGEEPFEKVAYTLILLWCLLPIYSALEHFYWGFFGVNDMGKQYAVMSGYVLAVQVVGSLSLVFALFYLVGRVVMNQGNILKKMKQEPWHFCLLAMLLWSCISTLLSDDVSRGFNGSTYMFDGLKSYFYYASVYVFAFIVMQGKRRKTILNVFALVSSVISVILILQDRGVGFITSAFRDERAAVFFHFNHAGYYLGMSILCVMGLYLYENRRKIQVLYLFGMILQIYAILVNSTLGSYLGVCCATVMMVAFFWRSLGRLKWKVAMPIVVLLAISVASYVGFVPTSSGEDMKVNIETMANDMQEIKEEGADAKNAGHGRMTLWKKGLEMIAKRPLFGYGPEQIDEEIFKDMVVSRPDNEIIQHGAFLGVPGMLFYLLALLSLFLHQWIYMKRLDVTTLIAAGCVISYIVSSLFGVTIFYTVPYFYMFLAMAAGRKKDEA